MKTREITDRLEAAAQNPDNWDVSGLLQDARDEIARLRSQEPPARPDAKEITLDRGDAEAVLYAFSWQINANAMDVDSVSLARRLLYTFPSLEEGHGWIGK